MAGHIPRKDILAEIRRLYSIKMAEDIDKQIMSELENNDNEIEHKHEEIS